MTQRVRLSTEEIDRVVNTACEEYAAHGLLTLSVWRTPVVRVATDAFIGFADGLYVVRSSPLGRWAGYRAGSIYVPQVSFVNAIRRLRGQRVTMLDVMRHELAHALAFKGKTLVRGWRAFERAFGGHHDSEEEVGAPRSEFVTDYAQTNPAEDFAESVMAYLRHDGRLDRWARRPGLRRKMELIASLPRRIQRMRLQA